MGENGGVSEHPEVPAATANTPEPTDAPMPAYAAAQPDTAGQATDSHLEQEPEVTPVLTPSQAKRASQTLKGMIISVLLTVAVAIPVILINPPNKAETYRDQIDIAAVRKKDKNQILIGERGESTLVLSSDSGMDTLDDLARLAQSEIPAN